MKRRDALILGTAVCVALAVPPFLRRRVDDFEFEPLTGFDGFRRLNRGAVTSTLDPFVGLDTDRPARPEGSACDVLFGTSPPSDALLPVAVFTDVNCANCAALESRLLRMIETGAPLRLVWHQLPLLGPRSVWAARLTLAARMQDAEDAVHHDLMRRGLRPGPAGARALAARHGLDADRLLLDAQGPAVDARLTAALGLGTALGLPGTPGIVMGRTLVIGAIAERDLQRLLELELAETPRRC